MIPSAIAFDIDGVIVDSEGLHFHVLLEEFPDLSTSRVQALIGLSLPETLSEIGVSTGKIPHHRDRIIANYSKTISREYLRGGVSQLITRLQKRNIPFGFVSTAPRRSCLANLSILSELKGKNFPVISCDDVKHTKPHPEPYRKFCEIQKCKPEQVIVVEDTDLGIEAATAAGIKHVYGWPHEHSPGQTYSRAKGVISELTDISYFSELMS